MVLLVLLKQEEMSRFRISKKQEIIVKPEEVVNYTPLVMKYSEALHDKRSKLHVER